MPLDGSIHEVCRINPVVFSSVAVGFQFNAVRRRNLRVFKQVVPAEDVNRLSLAVLYTRQVCLSGGLKAELDVLALAIEEAFFAVKHHPDARFGEIGGSDGVTHFFLERHCGIRQNDFRKIGRFVQHDIVAMQNDRAAIHRVRIVGIPFHRDLDVARS
ncbi:hypothetical protein D1872_263910 [compost metagenome]